MKLSEAWLREWANPPGDTESLVDLLTLHGLEVDDVEPVGAPLSQVVVGRVLSVAAHPNADRLRVCQVDSGRGTVQVVCGAPNVVEGGHYPLALPGARLPGGLVIGTTVLRGVDSGGMLCSGVELGLPDQPSGLLELEGVPGTPVESVLGLGDHVLDVNITPNRADCFSVAGLARDVAAVAGVELVTPDWPPVPAGIHDVFPGVVAAPAACPRLALRVIRGLRAGARSPLWMRERLRRSGIRAIHPLVDVTNYVMLELGQPLHAYDLARLAAPLTVRLAAPDETITLLGGQEARLADDVLVIADASGPVGIAGIMGGEGTGVADGTTDVLLESAFFTPDAVAGRARRHGLQTDASMRFERGVDPTGQEAALERATGLLLAIAGGQAGPVTVLEAGPRWQPRTLELRRQRLAQLLGTTVPDAKVGAILRRLGMTVQDSPAGWQVSAPARRFDIELEVDLVEEVARVYGYDQIPAQPARQAAVPGTASEHRVARDAVLSLLVARGYDEAITYSFTDARLDAVIAGGREGARLVNPIASDLAVMRQSLWPGLLGAIRHNLARQQDRVRLVEVGTRFVPVGPDVREDSVVAGIALGPAWPEQWAAPSAAVDFFDIKSDVEALLDLVQARADSRFESAAHPALHPGQSARLIRSGLDIGWLGALHPRLVAELELRGTPVLFELALDRLLVASVPAAGAVSRFPAVRRDLAILVPTKVEAGDLCAVVRESAGAALRDVIVFDVYAGPRIDPNVKSVALGLILQESSRTLTDGEVDSIVNGVIARLARDFNASLRE